MRRLGTYGIFLVFCAFCTVLTVFSAAAAQAAAVENIRFGKPDPASFRIVTELDSDSDFDVFFLNDPKRLVLDIPGAVFKTDIFTPEQRAPVSAFRFGTPEEGTGRIVFELKKRLTVKQAFFLPGKDGLPARIVVDVIDASAAVFAENIGAVWQRRRADGNTAFATRPAPLQVEQVAAQTIPEPAPESIAEIIADNPPPEESVEVITIALPSRKPVIRRYTVVIDPGHGGKDPGAVNGKIYEKHITLSLARQIKKKLEESGRYQVHLTRNRDIFVPLRERVSIARKAGAELFISIHADKIGRKDVRGSSLYTLSRQASDKETAKLAENANFSERIAGIDLSEQDEDIANILIDLAMRDTMNHSNVLAETLLKGFRKSKIRLLGRPHRSAGFAVLTAPDTPSVLLEAGFVSNRGEAILLSSTPYQQKIAAAILDGVDSYFKKLEQAALH
ncbi:MAG: N-acetylmuramoyl-L-alanine amidase [Alphaproteobacteria bacterium]|nr:MAG: N-acetylmuramoyl-L-alanine amidase [Alphaproteobacteria bacterium]